MTLLKLAISSAISGSLLTASSISVFETLYQVGQINFLPSRLRDNIPRKKGTFKIFENNNKILKYVVSIKILKGIFRF